MDVPLQLTMAIAPAHRNEYLFSDHYLDSLLPQDPRWEGALAQAEAFLGWLQGLYAQERKQLAKYNEDQLEEHWFKPILRQLGHAFEGQAGVPGLDAGVKRPDYVFFPDEGTRQAAAGAQNTQEYAAEALAVGDGANDLPMLIAAGTGVALHAKPRVQAECEVRVNHGDLTSLLFLQGFSREEFAA
jgi:hypothetical protein